jgi:hypothetical protein
MVVRGHLGRCLLLLLLVGVTAQALALAAHHPTFHIARTAPDGGDRGSDHDPSSCNLCQILSQVRVQAPAAPPLALPVLALECRVFSPTPVTPASFPRLSASSPRAPPGSLS